jgi:hypothetical protein
MDTFMAKHNQKELHEPNQNMGRNIPCPCRPVNNPGRLARTRAVHCLLITCPRLGRNQLKGCSSTAPSSSMISTVLPVRRADNVRPAGAATRINLAIIVVQDGDVANHPGLNPESAGRKCGREPGPIPGLRLLLSSRGAASMAVHRCGLSESGTSSGLARGRK